MVPGLAKWDVLSQRCLRETEEKRMNWVIAAIAVYLLPPAVVLCCTLVLAVRKQTEKLALALRRPAWGGRGPGAEQATLPQQQNHGRVPVADGTT